MKRSDKGCKGMELKESVERVNELTARFFSLTKEEVKELQILTRGLSVECSNILYDCGK